jgi:peroxiredoxin
MKRLIRQISTTALALGALAAAIGAAGFATAPKIGEKAPAFTLNDLDGHAVSLASELRGGPVVLVLLRGWPGYQCPFCTQQFGDFLKHAEAFERAGVRVVWVYPGPSERLGQHARDFTANKTIPASFRIVTDPDYAFTVAYGLRWDAPNETSYPATFVIDRTGIVRFAKISIAHDGRAAATEVLEALKTLSR